MTLQNLWKPILATCVLAAAGACGGSSFPGIFAPSDSGLGTEVAALTIVPDTVNVVALGDAVQMAATAMDASGAALTDAVIDWSSEDLSVATVSADGLVTAVGDGRTTITAAAGGVEATAVVTVGLTGALIGTP